MTKLGKIFHIIRNVINQPKILLLLADNAFIFKKKILKKYPQTSLPVVDILDIIPKLNETIQPYSYLEGGSTAIDLVLLKSLAKQFKPCNYLEIGSWRGESVANIVETGADCTIINLSEDEMQAMKLPTGYIKQHHLYSKDLANIHFIHHNSHTFDYSSLNKKFDLIFVDGDHHYDSVKKDTQKVFNLLRDDNSIIVWHDYGKTPESIRYDVFAGILDGLPSSEHKNLYHVSNTLCAIYTKQKLNTQPLSYPTQPNKVFEINIKAKKL